MPGFWWGAYGSDDGHVYALRVDTDFFTDAARGWIALEVTDAPQYPRGWRARYVLGLTETGQKRKAICASTSCALWTGEATSFGYRDTWGDIQSAVVVARVGEARIKK